MKPRLSYEDLETIFRYYATAAATNEPLSTYVPRLREHDASANPISNLVQVVSDRLRAIAAEGTRAMQARDCRVLLLDQSDRAVCDHYLAVGGDAPLRRVCLAELCGAEIDEDVQRKENETLWSYCNALWIETAIACLYETQFNSHLPLDDFSRPYRAMTELYTRILCAKLFSRAMSTHDREDLRRVSDLYEEACRDSTVRELSKIRANYRDAIKMGLAEDLSPLQQRFASVAQSAESRVESTFARAAGESDTPL